jgi:hypothetical protein
MCGEGMSAVLRIARRRRKQRADDAVARGGGESGAEGRVRVCLVCDSREPGSHLRYKLWPARLTGHRVSLIGSHLYTTWLAQKIDWLALQLHAACAFVSLYAGPRTRACFLRAWLAGNGRSQRFPGAWPVTFFCMS